MLGIPKVLNISKNFILKIYNLNLILPVIIVNKIKCKLMTIGIINLKVPVKIKSQKTFLKLSFGPHFNFLEPLKKQHKLTIRSYIVEIVYITIQQHSSTFFILQHVNAIIALIIQRSTLARNPIYRTTSRPVKVQEENLLYFLIIFQR